MSADKPASAVDEQKSLALDVADEETKVEKQQREALSELDRDKSGKALTLRVKVYSPFTDYFDGPAYSLSAENQLALLTYCLDTITSSPCYRPARWWYALPANSNWCVSK
jgi:hypothetical protein